MLTVKSLKCINTLYSYGLGYTLDIAVPMEYGEYTQAKSFKYDLILNQQS